MRSAIPGHRSARYFTIRGHCLLTLAATVGPSSAKLWDGLKPERRALLKLLARFEVTSDQATRWFVPEERDRAGIAVSDAEIIANPYVCFEADRGASIPSPYEPSIVAFSPCCHCSHPTSAGAVALLGGASTPPRAWVVHGDAGRGGNPGTHPPTSILARSARPRSRRRAPVHHRRRLDGSIRLVIVPDPSRCTDGRRLTCLAAQGYEQSRDLISARVTRRLAGKRHAGEHNWCALIDNPTAAVHSGHRS